MLKRMDTNVMMDYIGWVSCLSHLDTNAKEGYEYYEFHTVKPLITNTSEEFIKCRLDNFSMSFILYYVNFSICENK